MQSESYLLNAWYVAALSEEVTDNLLRRVILEWPILLLRDEATGEPAALIDACSHRFAPLSMGKRVADRDAGGVRVRRRLRRLIEDEQAGSQPSATGRPIGDRAPTPV